MIDGAIFPAPKQVQLRAPSGKFRVVRGTYSGAMTLVDDFDTVELAREAKAKESIPVAIYDEIGSLVD